MEGETAEMPEGAVEAVDEGTPQIREGLEIDLASRPILISMTGKCNSGKTVLLRSLLYHAARAGTWKWIIVFVGHDFSKDYSEILPEHCVRIFTPAAYMAVFDKIRTYKRANPDKALSHGLVVCDDCQGLFARLKNTVEFQNLLISHRHLGVSLAFLNQYATGQTTLQRSLTDIAFAFRASDVQSQKHLFKMMGSHFEGGLKEFQAAMRGLGQHNALVFKNNQLSFEDSYSIFKCQLPPKFKLKMKPNGL